MTANILVVDDEHNLLDFLTLMLGEEGYNVTPASSLTAARRELASSAFDLVLCDIMMPEGSGMDLLKEIHQADERANVIMMTAYTSSDTAVQAMKLGAYDYVSKPFDVEELKVLVQKALEKTSLVDENQYLRRELESKYTFSNIIGRSAPMQQVFSLIERVSRTSSTAMIHGESGTGKELIAKAIHFSGPRSQRRFLSVNCGAMPENLLESELFGHERGAFTGAVKTKPGLFQEASGGTLFLDEIGETTPTMQVKLLRVLQEKTVRKVGGTEEENVDARIIAATNRDLAKLVESGEFREDLYYRINVIPVNLPPLRDRRDDIPLLVDFFADKFALQLGMKPIRMTQRAMDLLQGYDWPGNVRELENLVERTMALSTADAIDVGDLPSQIRTGSHHSSSPTLLPKDGLDLEAHLDEIRRDLMLQALERSDWIQTQASELLQMTFRSFRYYAKKASLTGRGRSGSDDSDVDDEGDDLAN